MSDIVVQFRGTIYENGYGQIAQKVMRDKSVHAVSKAIYAYLVSFAGQDGSAFPSVELMMDELGIKSKDTFYKYRNQLIEAGYVAVEQQKRVGGQFYNNVYVIEILPCPKKQETEPSPKLSTTVKSTTKKSTTTNQETKSISSIQISTNHNKQNNNKQDVAVVADKIESELGTSIKSLVPLLGKWIEEYGEEHLIDVARYIGSAKGKYKNVVGTYRMAVTQSWEIAATGQGYMDEKPKKDPRYEHFYRLFPNE